MEQCTALRVNFNPFQLMNDVAVFVVGALVGGLLAWVVAGRRGADRVQSQVDRLLRELQETGGPGPGDQRRDELPVVRDLRGLFARERTSRNEERDQAVHMALARISAYLRRRVEVPLLGGLDQGSQKLRAAAGSALDAVEDLEFFLETPAASQSLAARDLLEVVQEVVREFGAQSDTLVTVTSSHGDVVARVDDESLKDAIFLLLHNAAEFGGGGPVQVVLEASSGQAHILVRDKGPGFSVEALTDALNPFYSTSPGGLGLGLPHARRAVEAQGGHLLLRNAEGGGAEVEIVLPLAE